MLFRSHPAKTQIKFAQEQAVFNALYHTVLDALAEQGGPVPAAPAEPEKTVNPRGDFFQSMDAKAYREQGAKPAAPAPRPAAPLPAWDTERTGPRLSDSAPPLPKTPSPRPAPGRSGAFPPLRQDAPSSVLGPKAERMETPPAPPAEPKIGRAHV